MKKIRLQKTSLVIIPIKFVNRIYFEYNLILTNNLFYLVFGRERNSFDKYENC